MIIVLLNKEIKLVGYVSVIDNSHIVTDILDTDGKSVIAKVVEKLSRSNPHIRIEEENDVIRSFGFEEVSKGDPGYGDAVVEEFKKAGYSAFPINNGVKDLLTFTARKLSEKHFRENVGDMLVLDEDEANAFVENLKKIV